MWRVLGLTLICLVGAASGANADSRLRAPGRGIETALHQSAAVAGTKHRSQRASSQILQLQVGGSLALSQPSLRASLAEDGARRALAPRLLSRRQQPTQGRGLKGARWLDLGGVRPTLAYPLTESLSLGLRYSYQRSEDLVFKVAKTGALDDSYQSHKVLLRAQWEW